MVYICRRRLAYPKAFVCVHRGKKWVWPFCNTGRVAGNPGKAARGVCSAVLKRTVMRIGGGGTCSLNVSQRTVPAEWERYLLNENGTCSNLKLAEMRVIAVIFPFLWNTTRAYHLRKIRTNNIDKFVSHVKSYLIDLYSYVCSVPNCFVCKTCVLCAPCYHVTLSNVPIYFCIYVHYSC